METKPLPIRPKPPATWQRIGALAIGVLLIGYYAYGVSLATELSYVLALLIVVLGAVAIMVVLTVYGVKALEARESWRRFDLSSLMLIAVPVGIYLTGFRTFLTRAPTHEFTPLIWTMLGVFAVLAMGVMTILLTAMAEALLWAAKLPLVRRPKQSK